MTPLGDGFYRRKEELEMLDGERFVRMIRRFGAQRVLFGTDSPWGDPASSLAAFRALPLTEEEQSLILEKNAEKLLDIRKA
jgi:predicted TIM-barrel fold metal-dependent hydrolase